MSDNKNDDNIEEVIPDDEGTFLIDSYIKIFDPETEEIYVHQR